MGTAFQESLYKEFLPDCLCKNGEKALYICVDEKCAHFKSLKSRLSKERYYCEDCMEKYHNHRPTRIIKMTFEIAPKWQGLDSDLTKFENQFHQNMHDYMDLINHYEDFAESQ
jgi:hypothetical protein